ncbi:MAG: Gfo/Idh/MocA family protein [Candidatus Hodarchaeales archaeon]
MHITPKVCVIGAGNMGRLHARILSRLRSLGAIADIHVEAKKIADRWNIPFYTNYEKMIKEINPTGLILATPTHTHFSLTKEILTNFPSIKGILIEKPLASSLDEAKQLENIAKDLPVTILVGHVERYNPVIERMLDILQANAIGEIRSIIIQRRGAVPEKRIPSIGDVFVDIGVHDFDVLSQILHGEFDMRVVGIKRNGNTCNAATIVLSKEGGPQCTLLLSREYAGRQRTIEIEGTGGTMIVDLVAQIIELRSLGVARGEERATVTPFREGERMKLYGEPLQEELMDFLDCLLTSKEPKVSLADGIAAIELVESARLSKKTGKVVQVSL